MHDQRIAELIGTSDHLDDARHGALYALPVMAAAKLCDAMISGFLPDFTPDEAQAAGAFVEDALSEQDAQDDGALVPSPAP